MASPRRRRIEETLDALGALRRAPLDAPAIARLREALASRRGVVAAKAASVAGDREVAVLLPDLLAAFDRFLADPVRTDPGCLATQAIAAALDALDHPDPAPFTRGAAHLQLEPAWGGPRDTAGPLRVTCAFALVRRRPAALPDLLADLLADAESPVRAGAARAIAATEDPALAPLLRLKVLLGDDEPQVTAECLGALLRVAPDTALPFLERLLATAAPATRETVALALGESRLRGALPLLREWWRRSSDPESRRTALLGVAMLRFDDALAVLLALVREGIGPDARDALAALAIHRHDAGLRARVLEAARRDDVDLRPALAPFMDADA